MFRSRRDGSRSRGSRRNRPHRRLNRRPLRFELLEDRRLLTVVTVDTDQDVIDLNDGLTSLREAIFAANTIAGPDTIEFADALTANGPATILLTMGELAITDSLTINGPGAELLTVDASGNDLTPDRDTGHGSRVFNINGGPAPLLDVEISGLRITGGDALGPGGGILTHENLTVRESIITGNSTSSTMADGGGGIFSVADLSYAGSFDTNLTVLDSIITHNSALRSEGGGIRKAVGSLTVERSVIAENRAGLSGGGISAANDLIQVAIRDSVIRDNVADLSSFANFGGGGVFLYDAVATISNSSIVENESRIGGGVYATSSNTLPVTPATTIINSTVSSNVAQNSVGGVYALTPVYITHSTIANNSLGGFFGNSIIIVDSTILAGNSPNVPDPLGDYNLVSPSTEGILGPLVGSGGPNFLDGSRMPVHAMLPGSPAIDAGDPNAVAGMGDVPEFDQRGMPWVRVANGDDVPEARIDIGAIEWQLNPLPGDYNFNWVVDAADYSVWRDTKGSTTDLRADSSSATTPGAPDGVVDEHDYAFWVENFGNVLAVGAGASELRAGGGEQGGSAVGGSALAEPVAPVLERPKAEGGGGKEDRLAVSASLVDAVPLVRIGVLRDADSRHDAAGDSLVRYAGVTMSAVVRRDRALMAWLAARGVSDGDTSSASETPPTNESEAAVADDAFRSPLDAMDAALAALSVRR